jgi:hypothetical protein
LESGWDYLYIEYSLNGGLTWVQKPIISFSGKCYLDEFLSYPFLTNNAVTISGCSLTAL